MGIWYRQMKYKAKFLERNEGENSLNERGRRGKTSWQKNHARRRSTRRLTEKGVEKPLTSEDRPERVKV